MNIFENPPAFPVELDYKLEPGEAQQTGERFAQFPGMTLRDWFAGQAIAGLLASDTKASHSEFAAHSYKTADAMLSYRNDNSRNE